MYDLHAHFISSVVLAWLQDHARELDVRRERRGPNAHDFLIVGGRWAFELKPAFLESEQFLRDQAEAGITHTLVSPIPQLFLYEAPAVRTIELAALYNETLAGWVRTYPDRLSGLATVPLNHPERAAEELRRAMRLGLKGAIIGPGCGGRLLTDAWFEPFWEEAERSQAIIFLHPVLSQDPRLSRPMMPNLVGVPWETTVAAADLVLGGLLDRYPRVKILLAHGGGFLPYQIGRFDTGYARWPAVQHQLRGVPSDYLRHFWFDTVLWRQDAVQYLLALVGEERVVPGSDYPFDLSEWPPAVVGEEGVRALLERSDSKHN